MISLRMWDRMGRKRKYQVHNPPSTLTFNMWAKIVYAVGTSHKPMSITDIMHITQCTYTSVGEWVHFLHKQGILTLEKSGRTILVGLTADGRKHYNYYAWVEYNHGVSILGNC